jgi:DNA helicase-2/ATP-dependent DNA helicase PcrA
MPMTTWSAEQQTAITKSLAGNTYIAAGPGSGKSTTLAEIARRLLTDNKRIMLITFTNKSAKDIIAKVGVEDLTSVMGGTFHSIAYKLMKLAGLEFTICDENKKRLIIKKLFDCRKDKEKYERIYDRISRNKSSYPVKACELTSVYDRELAKYNMLDFDDIIISGIDHIKGYVGTLNFNYILVDELQDTSQSQLIMLKELYKKGDLKIVGVGDLDQSIYEWRGARPENVREFISHFKCETSSLGLNFRSKSNIVQPSRKLIEHNKSRIDKDLRAFDTGVGVVASYRGADMFKEIDYVVAKCRRLQGHNITILYRNRMNKMRLEYELRKNNLSYRVNDCTEITDRSAFRVLLCMMRIAARIYDIYDLEEASKGMKALGKVTVDKIKELITKRRDLFILDDVIQKVCKDDKRIKRGVSNVSKIQAIFIKLGGKTLDKLVEELVKYIIDSFNIPKDIIDFLVDITKGYRVAANDIRDICNDFGLDNNPDQVNEDAKLELSTIHGYKGGERDIIILPFCDWDIRPDKNTRDPVEAERRLFYVAVTRPKSELYLTYSGANKPRFIKEMGL